MQNNYKFKQCELGVFNHNAKQVANLIQKDCRIMGLTRGQFSLIDLIFEILKKIGKSNIIITTWSAGIKDANQIKWMCESDLINDFKIITDHSYSTRQKKYAASIDELFGKENIRTSKIHAKFTLIQNENFNISIRTSMNLNDNKTCENFEIDDSLEIFNFYMNFINHTFANMNFGFVEENSVVNKCIKKFFDCNEKWQEENNWINKLKSANNIFPIE
jgi:hypothetical protein